MKPLRKTLSLILIIAVLLSISIPVQAAFGQGVLQVKGDGVTPKEHQALSMTVDSVASTSSLQAFCVGWNFNFKSADGSMSTNVYVPLSEVNTAGGTRTYTFPITTGWTLEYTGIAGGKSIRDCATYQYTFDQIIKGSFTVTANACVEKYSYSPDPAPKGTFTPLGVNANTAAEIDSVFSEFSSTFKTNTKADYYNLVLSLTAEPQYTNTVHFIYWDQATNTQMSVNQADMVVTDFGSITKNVTLATIPAGYEIVGRVFKYSSAMPTSWADYNTWDKLLYFPLAAPNTEGWIHILLNKPVPDTGKIYEMYLDKATNSIISSNIINNVPYNTAKSITSPALDGYTFKGSYKTFSSSIPAASNMQSGISTQTVTLSSTNTAAYIWSWYEADVVAPAEKPPFAFINNTNLVYAGDDVYIDGSASYDPDGTITNYIWSTPGANQSLGNVPGGLTWYPTEGTYGISLVVLDNSGLPAVANSSVTILKPLPTVNMNVTAAKMKENRKIVVDISGSTSPTRFPISWDLTTWTIDPVSGSGATGDYGVRFADGRVYKNVSGIAYQYNSGTWTNTGTAFTSILVGQKKLEFQARDSGQYKVTANLTNTASFNSALHYSNSTTKTLTVTEDLAPVADYSGVATTLRDKASPNGTTAPKYGVINLTSATNSPDGDPIGKKIWGYKYDSDNDGSFLDELTSYNFAPNLLSDANFLNLPMNWYYWDSSASSANFTTDNSEFYGTKTIKGSPNPNGSQSLYSWANTTGSIAGKQYTFSAYFKTKELTGNISVFSYWQNSSGVWIWENNQQSKVLTGTNDWTRLSVTSVAPANAVTALICIGITNGDGTYWIMAPKIEEGNVLTDFNNNNLLVDKNFSNLPSYWGSWDSTASPMNFKTVDCEFSTSKVIKGTPNANSVYAFYAPGYTDSSIAGKEFTYSLYVKTKDLTGGLYLATYWQNSSGAWVWDNVLNTADLTGTNDWTRLTITSTAPSSAAKPWFMVDVRGGSGTYWIMAPQLENADVVTDFKTNNNPFFTSGQCLIDTNNDDSNAEIWTYDVGKYAESLTVYEDIPDSETVKELLLQSDFRNVQVKGW